MHVLTAQMQTDVSALYAALFGRAPEKSGLAFWVGQLDSGVSMTQVAQTMYDTTPARAYYPTTMTNAQVVASFYQNVLGRTGDAEGLAFWEARLNTLGNKGALIAEMIANVQSYNGTDAAGLTSKALFTNKVSVGVNYAVTLGKEDVDLATAVMKLVTATDTTAANNLASNKGQTFTLTTGADGFAGTTGNDTIDGSVVNSLGASDVITDETTTDNDTLNVTLNTADVKATIKNIENVNVTWTSNASASLDATNMKGNTLNVSATGLAFTGAATVKAAGTNNVTAGAKIAALSVAGILDSKIDAGAAKTVTVDDAGVVVPVVGQKTAATITVNGDIAIVNTTLNRVDNLTVKATAASTVSLSGTAATDTGIDNKLTVTGSKDVNVKGVVTTKEIAKSMDAGAKLTVTATDIGTLDVTKVGADIINVAAAATAVTVIDNQKLTVVDGGSLTSLVKKAGLANVTTNLTTGSNLTTDVTGIENLNLEVTKVATIALTTNEANNVTIKGAGDLTLTSGTSTTAGIDASALTGKFTYTSNAAGIIGVVGSATAVNAISLGSSANETAITGAAADTIAITAANANTVVIKAGAGNDKITVGAALTGTASIDGGEGTDTLVVTDVAGVATATGISKVSLSGIEKIAAVTNANFNNVQLSGQTYELSGSGGSAAIKVFAFDKTGVATAATTDLSGLVVSTATGADITGVTITGITGRDVVDTIKGSKANDTIIAGQGADIVDISQGGADIIQIAAGDSTWSTSSNKMDKVTGFNAVAAGAGNVADKILFTAASVAPALAAATVTAGGVDVKGAITGGVASDSVKALLNNGVISLSGIDSTKIDTLVEWIDVAKAVLAEGDPAVAGETVAFAFGGDTYVLNAATAATATFDIVQLVGVTGVTAVGTGAAANTIQIGAIV